jgi:MFS family permease
MVEAKKDFRISPKARRRSINCAIAAAVVSVLGGTFISPSVMTLVALKLGAQEMYVGLLSFAALTPLVFSVFTMPVIEYRGKKPVILFWYSVSLIFMLPLLLLPWVAQSWSAGGCLVLIFAAIFLKTTTDSLAFVGWFPILHDVVPERITGRFFGQVRTAWQSAALLVLVFAAVFLGKDPDWWRFEVIFLIAFVFMIGRVFTFVPMTEKPPVKTRENKSSVLSLLREFFREKSLRRLMAYMLCYAAAFSISEPFKIKLLKDLGYSEGVILAAVAMINLGAIVSLRIWGRLADRFGNRFIFGITHLAMIVFTLGWLFVDKISHGMVLVFALYLVSSIFNSGNGIAQTRYILHAVAPDKQNHINILNMSCFAMWGIAPLLGAVFLILTDNLNDYLGQGNFNNYHLLFVVNALMFVVPHFLRRRLSLKKDPPTAQVLNFVIRPFLKFPPFMIFGKNKDK